MKTSLYVIPRSFIFVIHTILKTFIKDIKIIFKQIYTFNVKRIILFICKLFLIILANFCIVCFEFLTLKMEYSSL